MLTQSDLEGVESPPPQPPGIIGLSKSPHASDEEEEGDEDEGSRSRSLGTLAIQITITHGTLVHQRCHLQQGRTLGGVK